MQSVRTTINLPTELFYQAKLASVKQNITFTSLVTQALSATLDVPVATGQPFSHSLHEFRKTHTLPQGELATEYQKTIKQKYGSHLS